MRLCHGPPPSLQARTKLSARPWRVDHFDRFAEVWFSKSTLDEEGAGESWAVGFMDNVRGRDMVWG